MPGDIVRGNLTADALIKPGRLMKLPKAVGPLLILPILLLSGCTYLSSERHVVVEGDDVSRADSACGYFSVQWAQFGSENAARIVRDGMDVEFCANAHYSRIVAMGPVIPFVPISSGRVVEEQRWVRLSNLAKIAPVAVQSAGAPFLAVCMERYPHHDCPAIQQPGGFVRIEAGSAVWFSVPEDAELILQSGQKQHRFQLRDAMSFSWWLLTV